MRPVWLHGSRLTTAVVPAAAEPSLAERDGLGVGRTRSAVEAFGNDPAVVSEQHAAHPRVGAERHPRAGRERQCALHRGALRGGERHRLLSGPSRAPGQTARPTPISVVITCVRFPSGLSPSVQELHLVNRSLAVTGSRTSERKKRIDQSPPARNYTDPRARELLTRHRPACHTPNDLGHDLDHARPLGNFSDAPQVTAVWPPPRSSSPCSRAACSSPSRRATVRPRPRPRPPEPISAPDGRSATSERPAGAPVLGSCAPVTGGVDLCSDHAAPRFALRWTTDDGRSWNAQTFDCPAAAVGSGRLTEATPAGGGRWFRRRDPPAVRDGAALR